MTELPPPVSRRAILSGSGVAALSGSLALSASFAETAAAAPAKTPDPGSKGSLSKGSRRMRPTYHFSVPDHWKNDPQRPIYLDGEYHYYYLYNADYLQGG
ncbi:MAG TPA: glycoside hydrolase family 32 protein, partial [Arthrobacter sp.]